MRRCRDSLEYLGTSSQEDGILTYDSKTLLIYREDLFELINLWVAVVARIICRSAEKKSIVIQTLALLATIAAKLKVVCTNLRKFAQISVGNYLPYGLHWTAYGNVRTADARPGIRTSKKDTLRAMYMQQCSDLRARVLKIMFYHLLRLRGNDVLQVRTLAKYEISAMVHEIGLDRFRTLVFQDQSTHFTGTAQPYTVSCISQALYDINAVVKRLERDETTVPQPANTAPSATIVADTADDASIGTRIASSYFLEKDKVATFDALGVASIQQPDLDSTALHQHPAKVYLKSMSNVISVLVPLLFLHPMISTLVGDALASMSDDFWREAEAAFTRPSHRVSASFSLDTKAYREEQESPLRRPSDSRSLSNSSVRRGALLAGETVASIGRRVDSAPLASGPGATTAATMRSSSPHGVEWSDW